MLRICVQHKSSTLVRKTTVARLQSDYRYDLKNARAFSSGEGGIRTLGALACTPVFETGPIGRSGTSPGNVRPPILGKAARSNNRYGALPFMRCAAAKRLHPPHPAALQPHADSKMVILVETTSATHPGCRLGTGVGSKG
jgi:hypothetical protein